MRKIRFSRQHAVMERTGLTKSTLYKEIQEGSFPPPVSISERCVAWREDQIDEWCEAKAVGRTLHYNVGPAARKVRADGSKLVRLKIKQEAIHPQQLRLMVKHDSTPPKRVRLAISSGEK